ncbi:AraC family transcriptional regulator [Halopolyspora algeriensis]|uniref:AraC family transcriptional regulator n=1 Tax=Halopolyspora algeriensis TaxID=1500506 RepID=A0A368VZF2_9ACTN|nr:AraC family transcriptional regulator [Halopolyspora algeriensis]RCW46222.1 AraC family transcriptional regulator [Halopolyspora algeriensis]TQM55625.1 AraC family transcriptional regulator [Halopolyspora algeriensis]
MAELGLRDTNGILCLPWIRPERTSAGLGWDGLYVSTQREQPYRADFDAAGCHQLILHRSGPVTVRRGRNRLTSSRRIPTGGYFLHPAGKDLTVELGGELDTVHVYLDQAAIRQACGHAVELDEVLGSHDPLLEQLVLSLDEVLRERDTSARTYVDHIGNLLAARLARNHSRGRLVEPAKAERTALTDRQFDTVREWMCDRLDEPIPLASMAGLVGLSVSQFSRKFKARTGSPPHRFLLRLRLEQASRLLRTGTLSIAEIAVRCGFSHQEHLTRTMREHLGVTPAALRRAG